MTAPVERSATIPGTALLLRLLEWVVGGSPVQVEPGVIQSGDDPAQLARVASATPGATDSGVVVRQAESAMTLAFPDFATAGAADSVIVAAGSLTSKREVLLSIDSAADTGVYLNVGAAATSSKFFFKAGGTVRYNSNQALHAIRAGTADVRVDIITGVPA